MKITELKNQSAKWDKNNNDTPKHIGDGIIETLIEKYKPKGIYSLESIGNTKSQKEAA